MDFDKKTILGLFDGRIQYSIPVYQRAYTWEEKNWKVFLEDIKEASQSSNPYFYGNILLETIETDKNYDIIDGQQRITTLILFFYSLYKIKLSKFNVIEEDIYETFIKNKHGYKLEPVSYDRVFFNQLLDNDKNTIEPETPSQKQLKKCISYFEKELSKLDLVQIDSWGKTIQTANVTTVKLQEKKESALMFELQNNRGLPLTNMEKLKSYLMYQVYTNTNQDETEHKLQYIATQFEEIYRLISRCLIDEDTVLIAHCQCYINGFNYRNLDDIKEVYKKSDNKIQWIETFVHNLHRSFQIILEFQKMDTKETELLKHDTISFVYPFIIKGFMFINADNQSKRNLLIRLLEIITFRYRLISSRADFISRINPILTEFSTDDISTLASLFKRKFEDTWYWRDEKVEEVLQNINYHSHPKQVKYILSIYEDLELSGQPFNKLIKNENINIEHIYPQTESGKPIADGYDLSELSDSDLWYYTHDLGNLLLIDKKLNSSIGNRPYQEKLQSYENGYEKSPILQQQLKIKTYSKDIWCDKCIDKRHNLIVEFINEFWSFDKIINQI